ncbi:hypothetical protein EJ04DRAFT_427879 [Polyplosphaeria fusca]|uniref:Uncharacterized protein n=1 Tax=Polyplosphaeria fusca TaxID=682080 RepID=A0A9P4R6B1_9PLEO|nr:hypothetical protein EJ04DRAFT_427879 [Polyplosphaeria fusca]
MDKEFHPDPNFLPWGPFVSPNFENEPITLSDIITASVVWGITLCCVGLAIYLGTKQTRSSRSPLRSTYVWMIWIELFVCFMMGFECYLHLFKIIKPSFAFYMSILFWWCIQVQLLLQIIINRIRVILPDRRRSKRIMIATAVVVTAINISVFNIWIPSRLQVSHRYVLINEIWDRIEKVLYLLIDAALNWYFLRVVKRNLINNGLDKYHKLLRFNQRIIIFSLLMDVMIIAAMSMPNSFVYIQFHPLAYLVKLNIEMTMADLIKRIAVSTSRRTGNASLVAEFNSSSNKSSTNPTSHGRRSSIIELSNYLSSTSKSKHPSRAGKTASFQPMGNQIKKTEEIHIQSEPNPEFEFPVQGLTVQEREVTKSKSLDDVTEGGESVKSEQRRDNDSSDDEAILWQSKGGWGR